jgi:hypothetical protein
VAFWAVSFLILPQGPELDTFDRSFNFSLVTFTTLGYGDVTIASESRILAGLEALMVLYFLAGPQLLCLRFSGK